MLSRSRTYVHDAVSRAHCILIVLDDDQGISQISQIFQCIQKLVIIPLVQTYTRLIQDIGDSDQTGADLSRESYALSLASGKSSRRSGQGQIIKAYVAQE